MRTLLAGAVVVTCDASHTIHIPGDVLIDGDRIAYVGPSYSGPYDRRIDAGGCLVMPGLINAHTHSPMTLFRSLADDVDLQVFLEERVWPREVVLTPEDVYAGAALAAVEMLKSGVTTYADMYFWEEQLAQAALDVGIRSLQTPGILESPAWEAILGTWERRLDRVLSFCRDWEGRGGLIHTGVGPHAPYTLPLEALREIAGEAHRRGLLVHIHLVETQREQREFNARGQGSTAQILEGIGFFDGPVLAAHSVWIDDGDELIYARHGVAVAHCPQSKAKLGSGIAPLARLLARAVVVGLGTDGAATNNNLDLWEEIRLAPLLAKVSALDPKPVPAGQALAMATRQGAAALRLPAVGTLEEGKKADVILLNLDETIVPIFTPSTYIDHLVYSGGRHLVDSVWVNGRHVVDGGHVRTVDEEAVRAAAQRAALAVSRRIEGVGV